MPASSPNAWRILLPGRLTGALHLTASISTLWDLAGAGAWDLAHAWIDDRLLLVSASDSDPAAYDWSMLSEALPHDG